MGKDRTKVLVLALASLGLIVLGTLILDWFVCHASAPVELGFDRFNIDLRSFRICGRDIACVTTPLPHGGYWLLGTITFWGSLGFAAILSYQVASHLIAGFVTPRVSVSGYTVGSVALICATFAAYWLQPESSALGALSFTVVRTWAPSMVILGHLLGLFAIYQATKPTSDGADFPELDPKIPVARARQPSRTSPPPVAAEEPKSERGREDPRATPERIELVPEKVRGKLRFAALTAELTRGGIDARREDKSSLLIMWRDVVGVVARRLPPAYDGATFIDLVSLAGSTLRILPWTRLSGDPIEGEDAARARALVKLVIARCPACKVDPATRKFTDGVLPEAAQLPDLETLATHDKRLA